MCPFAFFLWHYMVLGFRFFIKKEYSQKTNFCAFLNRDTKKRWLWRRRRRPPMNASTSPFFPANNNNERTSKTHFVWTRAFRRCLFKNTTQTSSFFSTIRCALRESKRGIPNRRLRHRETAKCNQCAIREKEESLERIERGYFANARKRQSDNHALRRRRERTKK